jgi:hypothetical protein
MRSYNVRLWAKEELDEKTFTWRGWDMWRDYSGHLMTNHGEHTVDMAQLALGKDGTGPIDIRLELDGYDGPMRECPITMRYADGVELQFSMPSLPLERMKRPRTPRPRDVYAGANGVLRMGRNIFRVEPPELVSDPPDPSILEKWSGGGEHVSRPHIQNWLDCIHSRQIPNAPVEAGHRTATICHLANIARQLRRNLHWNPQTETIEGDEEANALLTRPRRPGFELP